VAGGRHFLAAKEGTPTIGRPSRRIGRKRNSDTNFKNVRARVFDINGGHKSLSVIGMSHWVIIAGTIADNCKMRDICVGTIHHRGSDSSRFSAAWPHEPKTAPPVPSSRRSRRRPAEPPVDAARRQDNVKKAGFESIFGPRPAVTPAAHAHPHTDTRGICAVVRTCSREHGPRATTRPETEPIINESDFWRPSDNPLDPLRAGACSLCLHLSACC
jgi:hypothetical protein